MLQLLIVKICQTYYFEDAYKDRKLFYCFNLKNVYFIDDRY